MTVIAMTREMGTLGKDVAHDLANDLGLKVIHSELVEHDLANKLGLQESAVHRYLEGGASLLERWKVDKTKLARCTAEEMLEIAQQGNAVIRGWGAVSVLQNVPHVLRVRVCAPMPFREKVMMERLGHQDPTVVRREIARNDAAHAEVMRKFFAADWEDPKLYHLVLNTGSVPVDACVRTIRQLLDEPAFQEGEETRGVLADKLIEHRVYSAISRTFGTAADVSVNVTGGRLVLSGTVGRNVLSSDVAKVGRGISGVRAVEDNIRETGGVSRVL
jgi:cytidylate kinase